jgi:3-dehydroquinate synthase
MPDASDARPSRSSGRPERAGSIESGSLPAPLDIWQQQVVLELEYPVVFTRKVFDPANTTFAWALSRREPERRHRAVVVLDEGVTTAWPNLERAILGYAAGHADRLELVDAPRIVMGGEGAKNDPGLVDSLHRWFRHNRLDRHAFVVVVGGGAVLDAVGYAAATAHRGLRMVRIPTTVLAQNDAGIGVKNGVNAFGAKNYLGTFSPPFAVLNDVDFVSTLEPRDRIAGIAEAIKVALIRDPAFFTWLETHADELALGETQTTARMIRRCAELHLEHIRSSGDPFETGSARPLDFGHWAAHKLETLSDHALRHGEAVALGMAIDTLYSARRAGLAPEDAQRVCAVIGAVGLPLWHEALAQRDPSGRPGVLDGLDEFREHLGGQLTITLLDAIGRGFETDVIDETAMIEVIAVMEQMCTKTSWKAFAPQG